MIYEINVSLNGQHFFTTASRSLTCREHARRVFVEIQSRFTKADGYKVTVTASEKFAMHVTEAFLHGTNDAPICRIGFNLGE